MRDDLFFTEVVHSYTDNPRFLRREWLAAEVDSFLKVPDCRFLLLTAEPGAGKSTFLAQLASDHPSCLVYFLRHDQRATSGDLGARSFLLRIGYQLAALHPELFDKEMVQLTIEQRVGTVGHEGNVVAAEVERILASPFYQKILTIRQQVELSNGSVTGLHIGEWVVEPRFLSLTDLQNISLIDPALALLESQPDQQVIILVDALDELQNQDMIITSEVLDKFHDHDTERTLLSWLTNCPRLPSNLRFVLTSRPSNIALQTLCQKQELYLRELTIEPEDKRVQDDLSSYIRTLVSQENVSEALRETTNGIEGFEANAVKKAEGNLGYLDALARGIDQSLAVKGDQQALRQLLELEELPDHLEGLYAFFLHQIKSSVQRQSIEFEDPGTGETRYKLAWPAVYMRILGVLAVAREPLSVSQIRDLGNISVEWPHLIEAIDRLTQFLDRPHDGYRFYHATVAEFLTDVRTREHPDFGDLYIDASRWHKRVANHYWTFYQANWRGCDSYGLKYLATHLFHSGDHDRLQTLISREWMQARYEQNGYLYTGFMDDVDLAWRAAAAQGDADELTLARLQAVREVVGQRVSVYTDSDLEVLVRLGRTEEALAHARLRQQSVKRFDGALVIYKTVAAMAQHNAELWQEVQQIAHTISDPRDHIQALMKLARVDPGSRADSISHLGLAAGVARSIESEGDRTDVLKILIQTAKGRCGELYDALNESIETIEDVDLRADLLITLADALAHTTDPRVFDLVSNVLALTEDIPDAEARFYRLRILGEFMIRREIPDVEKVWQAALVACRQNKDLFSRTLDLAWLARLIAPASGRWASEIFSEALVTVRKIRKKVVYIAGLCHLSREMFLARDAAGGEVLDEAKTQSLKLVNKDYRSQALAEVAETLAQCGRYDEACEMAMLVLPDHRRSTVNKVLSCLVAAQRYEEGAGLLSLLNTRADIASGIDSAINGLQTLLASGGNSAALAASRLQQATKRRDRIHESQGSARSSPGKVDVLNDLSQLMTRLPEGPDTPAETSKSFPSNGSAALVTALVEANNSEALSVLAIIPNTEDRQKAAAEASKVLTRMGRFAEARELILDNGAEELGTGIDGAAASFVALLRGAWADPRVEAQETLARALVQAGRESEALNQVRSWEDAGQRDTLLLALSDVLAEVGQFASAGEVASEISFGRNRLQGLRSLAVTMARAGDTQTKEVFQEALELSNAACDPEERSVTLLAVARALASRGNSIAKQLFQQSREMEITSARERRGEASVQSIQRLISAGEVDFETIAQLSRTHALAKVGYFEMAEEAAREINHTTSREEARSMIASQLVIQGRWQEGLQVANDLRVSKVRLDTLLSLVEQLDLQGHEHTLELFDNIYGQISALDEENPDRSALTKRAIEVLTGALIRAEYFDDACRFARAVPDDECTGSLLADVGERLIDSGRVDEAKTLADSLTNVEIATRVRDRVNATLAPIEMRRGRPGEADVLLNQIQHQHSKQRCAQSIVGACIESGHFSEALKRLDAPGMDALISMLSRQADSLDQWRPGLAQAAISAATEVAGWTDAMWREVHDNISAAGKPQPMPRLDLALGSGRKLLVTALCWLCEVVAGHGDYEKVCDLLAKIRNEAKQPDELRRAAKLASQVASTAMKEGATESAALVLREGLQIARDEGPIDGVAIFLSLLAQAELKLGRVEESQALAEEGLALSEQKGGSELILHSLSSLGLISEKRGDISAARSYYRRALTLSEECGNPMQGIALLVQLRELDKIDKQPRRSSVKIKSLGKKSTSKKRVTSTSKRTTRSKSRSERKPA